MWEALHLEIVTQWLLRLLHHKHSISHPSVTKVYPIKWACILQDVPSKYQSKQARNKGVLATTIAL